MIDFRPVLFSVGLLVALLALAMCLPAAVDAAHGDRDWLVFAGSASVTLFIGLTLAIANRQRPSLHLSVRQMFLLAVFGWLSVSVAAALPFAFSAHRLSVTDAFFEAVSGVTATGASVLRGLDHAPPGLLLWRALLQWLGGMGILVMGLLVLPTLNIGGMQIFRLETAQFVDRVMPRPAKVMASILGIYTGMTVLLTLLLWMAGMSRFPSLLHAMTTISCGGFSTSDGSIGHWRSPAVDWVILAGMGLGGAPFIIYLQLAQKRWRAALRNTQLRWYGVAMLTSAVLIGLWLYVGQDVKPLPALRHGLFTAASVMTGTGFATLDWGRWTGFPMAILFFLSFVGGCAGSTAGGVKLFRLQILYATARAQMVRLLMPNAVVLPQYEARPIPEMVAESVLGYLFVYSLSFALLAMALGMVGLDFVSSISAAAGALANLGPGFGAAVGPMNGFGNLPDAAKWLLAAGMLFGRLEMFAVLALFYRGFWRP